MSTTVISLILISLPIRAADTWKTVVKKELHALPKGYMPAGEQLSSYLPALFKEVTGIQYDPKWSELRIIEAMDWPSGGIHLVYGGVIPPDLELPADYGYLMTGQITDLQFGELELLYKNIGRIQ